MTLNGNRAVPRHAVMPSALLLSVIFALGSPGETTGLAETRAYQAVSGPARLDNPEPPFDYFLPSRIYQFADYLYREGQYLRAAGEYQRYLILTEGNAELFSGVDYDTEFLQRDLAPGTDSVLFLTGRSLRLGGASQQAVPILQKAVQANRSGDMTARAQFEIAASYFMMGDYAKSLEATRAVPIAPDVGVRIKDVELLSLLMMRDWQEARSMSQALSIKDANGLALRQIAIETSLLSRKNPALAGSLSLVPGLGKVYAGRSSDGLFSFLLIGITAWQAYEGFRKDGSSSVKGWMYGSASATLYLGNIWGSIVAAWQHNERQEDALLERALTIGTELLR